MGDHVTFVIYAPATGITPSDVAGGHEGPGHGYTRHAGGCEVLIPADVALDQFVHKERLLGDGETFYEPQNINVSLCLPGWKFKCTLHNENGTHTVEAVWRVLVSRYWTTI